MVCKSLHTPYDRVEDEDQSSECACREMRQMSPIRGAKRLRNDLRKDEDEDGCDSGYQSEPCAAKQQCGLTTYACSTDGVGDGVQ